MMCNILAGNAATTNGYMGMRANKAMKYINAVAVAGAMVWLVGCASASRVVVVEPVGPGPLSGPQGAGEGSLVIYSARIPASIDINMETWRWNEDFGKNAFMYEPGHTDYTIYAQNGEVLQHVRNARGGNDDPPTLVSLPAGSFKVEAQGVDCNSSRVNVLMTVVIKPGQATMAHLEGGWNPGAPISETQVARLPCGRAIGWSAPEAGLASN
jgi:hypothetical protein